MTTRVCLIADNVKGAAYATAADGSGRHLSDGQEVTLIEQRISDATIDVNGSGRHTVRLGDGAFECRLAPVSPREVPS